MPNISEKQTQKRAKLKKLDQGVIPILSEFVEYIYKIFICMDIWILYF